MHLRFLDRDKVSMKHPGKPHRMKIKISNHDREMRIQQILCDQVGDNACRHEMGADRYVEIEITNELVQRSGVQAIEHQGHPVGLPWLVTLFVPPAEDLGSSLN